MVRVRGKELRVRSKKIRAGKSGKSEKQREKESPREREMCREAGPRLERRSF